MTALDLKPGGNNTKLLQKRLQAVGQHLHGQHEPQDSVRTHGVTRKGGMKTDWTRDAHPMHGKNALGAPSGAKAGVGSELTGTMFATQPYADAGHGAGAGHAVGAGGVGAATNDKRANVVNGVQNVRTATFVLCHYV